MKLALPALVGGAAAFQLPPPPTKLSQPKVIADAVLPFAAAAVLAASAAPALAGDAGLGVAVFDSNCAACHSGGQNVIMPDKTLEKEALEAYLDGGFKPEAVVKQVTNGKNAMPAFGGRLTDEAIANVAQYVIETSKAGW